MDRRHFLSHLGRVTAGTSVTLAAASGRVEGGAVGVEPLPTIALGEHRLSRLIAGSNPLNGYSYLGPHVDRHMKEYFTLDRSVEFLLACERAGINTHQCSFHGDATKIVRSARERGSKINVFCLARNPDEVRPAVTSIDPIALVHHGGVTDRRFAEGKSGLVHDFVKAVHDQGLLAGVSAHNPDCIKKVADEGWDVDFFMTCFYFLTRKTFYPAGKPKPEPDTLYFTYPFYRRDPVIMSRVVQQVDKPCLAFKILAAGRKCSSPATVREAFRFAFENIKPTDGVIVGMFPWSSDEVGMNGGYTREFGKLSRS